MHKYCQYKIFNFKKNYFYSLILARYTDNITSITSFLNITNHITLFSHPPAVYSQSENKNCLTLFICMVFSALSLLNSYYR